MKAIIKYYFNPWIGPNYNNISNQNGKKILLVGKTHYCENSVDKDACGLNRNPCVSFSPNCENMTQNAVSDYLNGDVKYKPSYDNITEVLSSLPFMGSTPADVWNNIAFCNFSQGIPGLRYPDDVENLQFLNDYKNSDLWKDSLNVFIDIVKTYKPQRIIIMNKEIHKKLQITQETLKVNNLPSGLEDLYFWDEVEVLPGKSSATDIPVMYMPYPSFRDFNVDQYKELVKKFVQ